MSPTPRPRTRGKTAPISQTSRLARRNPAAIIRLAPFSLVNCAGGLRFAAMRWSASGTFGVTGRVDDVRSWGAGPCCRVHQRLEKMSFLADDRNFSGPLVCSTRNDLRDHIDSHKSDHRPSLPSYKALQRRRQLKIDLREIFGVARFSTFSTVSTRSGHAQRGTINCNSRRGSYLVRRIKNGSVELFSAHSHS
jgi:hypothetical protein